MQVRLVTTIESIIDIGPANTDNFETARREIFNRYNEALDQDGEQSQYIQAVQAIQSGCVVYDTIRSQTVRSSFEEVK